MTSPAAPTGTWPPTTHQHVQDQVTQLRTAPPPHVHGVADITATGVRSSSVYLRGDGTWATPTTSGGTTTTGRTDLYPEDYGYNSAGTASANQTAMQNFLNAITVGKTGVIRRGLLYQHNGTLSTLSTAGGRLVLDGELQATVQTASSFTINADGFVLEGTGKLTAVNLTARGSTLQHQKLVINGADGVRIDGITVDGSHATGFMSWGGKNYLVRDVTLKNTKADGFHNTNGSTGGRFRGTTAINVGDDTMAVVSYQSNGVVCSDIDVQGHRAFNGSARGLAVVGGTDIRYADSEVYGCSAAGIYIAAESSFNSYGCTNVRMRDIRIHNANKAATDHGSAMFFSSATGQSLTDCSIDGLITETLVRDDAGSISGWLRFVESGTPGTSARLSINDAHLRGTGPASNTQGNMATGVWEATNITRQASW